jgi:hypothetical protein
MASKNNFMLVPCSVLSSTYPVNVNISYTFSKDTSRRLILYAWSQELNGFVMYMGVSKGWEGGASQASEI